jgi:DNA (cytosine-5)-methyltransferase 1
MKHFGDITKLSGYDLPPVSIITGGSPCQDLSVAGKRAGLAGERSGLFMEQIRLIKEMRENDRKNGRTDEHIRPRFMVWENVPGAFSSNKGEDFRAVLEETAKVAEGDACIPGSPNGKWPHAGCIMGDGWSIAWRVHDAQFWGVPQRRKRIALVADFGGETAPEILFERKGMSGNSAESGEERKGTAEDAERSTRTTGFSFGQSAKARSLGLQEPGTHASGSHLTKTLVTNIFDARGNGDGATSPTITGDHENRVTDYTAVCVGNGQAAQTRISDKVGALNCMHDQQAVMQGISGDVAGTLDASYYKGCGERQGVEREVVASSVVRRLTPLECERLQGYPDHWTDIGEWVDSKGKKHKGESDSPRYKALGNSIALPFWQWMAEKMVKYVDEQTMASLFDGIGGFPLVFSRCGCTPVWASEIEEFPIAVTKIRFPE